MDHILLKKKQNKCLINVHRTFWPPHFAGIHTCREISQIFLKNPALNLFYVSVIGEEKKKTINKMK